MTSMYIASMSEQLSDDYNNDHTSYVVSEALDVQDAHAQTLSSEEFNLSHATDFNHDSWI